MLTVQMIQEELKITMRKLIICHMKYNEMNIL